MNRIPKLLAFISIVVLVLFLSYQGYQLNQVRLGKTKTASTFMQQEAHTDDPLALLKTASLSELAGENLMGDPNKSPEKPAAIVKPTEPPINLILMGIIISTNESKSSAFIQTGMQTKRYFIGQTVDGGAVLQSITPDTVFLKRGENVEALRYPAASNTGAPPVMATAYTPSVVSPRPAVSAATPVVNSQSAPVAPEPKPGDIRSRLWRLPPATPGGPPRDRERKTN